MLRVALLPSRHKELPSLPLSPPLSSTFSPSHPYLLTHAHFLSLSGEALSPILSTKSCSHSQSFFVSLSLTLSHHLPLSLSRSPVLTLSPFCFLSIIQANLPLVWTQQSVRRRQRRRRQQRRRQQQRVRLHLKLNHWMHTKTLKGASTQPWNEHEKERKATRMK